jgi:hypothetical protein
MWIITKENGIFNTYQISNIFERDGVTFAVMGGKGRYLSQKPVLEKILAGLRAELDFLEVE